MSRALRRGMDTEGADGSMGRKIDPLRKQRDADLERVIGDVEEL